MVNLNNAFDDIKKYMTERCVFFAGTDFFCSSGTKCITFETTHLNGYLSRFGNYTNVIVNIRSKSLEVVLVLNDNYIQKKELIIKTLDSISTWQQSNKNYLYGTSSHSVEIRFVYYDFAGVFGYGLTLENLIIEFNKSCDQLLMALGQ